MKHNGGLFAFGISNNSYRISVQLNWVVYLGHQRKIGEEEEKEEIKGETFYSYLQSNWIGKY